MSGGERRIEVNDDVYLSAVRASDQGALVAYLNDGDIYRATLRIPSPYSFEQAGNFIRIAAEATAKHGFPVHFAIRTRDAKMIGCCGFDGLEIGHRAEIGYWLGKPFWGRGLMTAVVRSACDMAFADWKLVRIQAHVFEFNQASSRVLEKSGFQLEGLLRRYTRKDGEYFHSKLYALVP